MKSINRLHGSPLKDPERIEPHNIAGKSSKNSKGQRNSGAAATVPDDYMTLINRDYVYEFASDGYCRALGRTRQEVANNPVSSVWGEEIFYEIIKKCLDRCFAGEPTQYEGWMEFRRQGRKYYRVYHHPYLNEQGAVTHAAVSLQDMTECKAEEEVLQKGRSYLRDVLKNIHFGVYTFDTEGRFTFVNDVVVERTGYPREWFNGKSLFDFVRPEEREEVRRHFEASILGEQVLPYEFAYYKASGKMSWVQVNTTPIWEKGRIAGVLGVLLDITKRRRSEHGWRESEEKYRMLFEDSMDAIFITDWQGKIVDANRSFLHLFGYTKEEAMGMDVIEMYANGSDREICVTAMKEKGYVKDYGLKLKKKDGTIMDCLLTSTARRAESGAIISYQGIVRDESGKRELEKALNDSESKLRSIIYGSPIPQFVIDRNHTVTHWNKALEDVSGISAREMVGTKQHWKAFYRTERPCMADLIVEGAEASIYNWYKGKNRDEKPGVLEVPYRAMDFFQELGAEGKWLYFTAAAISDSQGNIVGAIETLEDVTEYKIAEDAIRKAEEKCLGILKAVSRRT